jgi:hypothetical protein
MILVRTNRHFKGGDVTDAIRANTGVIHRIRTLVVLIGGKLIEIYFLHLFSITTHRQ